MGAGSVSMNTKSEPFRPKKKTQENEAYIDDNLNYIKELEYCTCCKGFINNCRGIACKNLGVCFCYPDFIHNQEL